ncbi:MAG: hypothetical protein VKJ24_18215 [Synechococcales bacterium]|nr:hypothetical protein [Synechococcales bacterium]
MASQNSSTARFRPATEFPKTIASLNPEQAEQLYGEMRDCLIFTNRSRAQLMRRNGEHKTTIVQLRSDLGSLQSSINQLNLAEQERLAEKQQIITALSQQLGTMTDRLDQLSLAFDDVASIESPMGVMSLPNRFTKFWQALKALIIWWREEQDDGTTIVPLPSRAELEADRAENPQMYTDPASVQRSLRDQ